ncbi:MAG: hypothetical protein H6Q69_3163 [Firmicutes bacterium]|nr:hypothetical protein [Bacillota bacterium]
MKKKVLATFAALSVVTSVGFASPLTDYSAGKTAIDLNFRNSDINVTGGGVSPDYDKKYNLDWGITTGLGNKFAIQYNGYNAKSKDTTFISSIESTKVKTQEFNVLYQLNKNVSVYAGSIKVKGSVTDVGNSTTYTADDKSKIQFGLVGSTKIAEKTTAYASLAVASDITNWKIGVSQEIAPNLEFNLDYRNMKVKDVEFVSGGNSYDVKSKGLGYGVTYKF